LDAAVRARGGLLPAGTSRPIGPIDAFGTETNGAANGRPIGTIGTLESRACAARERAQ